MSANSDVAGIKALQVLGMPTDGCKNLTIQFRPGNLVMVCAEYYVGEGELDEIVEIVRRVPVEEPAAP